MKNVSNYYFLKIQDKKRILHRATILMIGFHPYGAKFFEKYCNSTNSRNLVTTTSFSVLFLHVLKAFFMYPAHLYSKAGDFERVTSKTFEAKSKDYNETVLLYFVYLVN